jgi:spermidine/putrescine ABC transporter ATP-binding subunit
VVAVAGIDLEIAQGEFFTLLGPSGSGKTTTLRMIAGFEIPSSGTIELAGKDVSGVPPYDRAVNTVFQDYALFPHMTVGQNVEYGLKVSHIAKAERSRRRDEAMEMVRLPGYADRKPGELSGGQRQRVALARSIVNRPKVLLLDEPLGALDLKLRKELQVELKRIQRDVGITFVYVTHDQEEALTMSDRIAVMNHGRVEQVADPETVYDQPETTFVAGFIGVSNLMPAKVTGAGEIQLDQGPTLSAETGSLRAGDRCHAVVRPEKLRIDALEGQGAASSNGLPTVEGTVESSLYLGTSTQIAVDLGDGVRMTVLVPNASEAERRRLPGGGVRVELSWEPENMHVVRESVTGNLNSEANGASGDGELEVTRRGGSDEQ